MYLNKVAIVNLNTHQENLPINPFYIEGGWAWPWGMVVFLDFETSLEGVIPTPPHS